MHVYRLEHRTCHKSGHGPNINFGRQNSCGAAAGHFGHRGPSPMSDFYIDIVGESLCPEGYRMSPDLFCGVADFQVKYWWHEDADPFVLWPQLNQQGWYFVEYLVNSFDGWTRYGNSQILFRRDTSRCLRVIANPPNEFLNVGGWRSL